MDLSPVTLEDKYSQRSGRIYLTGIQALVRLLLVQGLRDRERGLNTAGFVSGYRGSPLGGLDLQLGKARALLAEHDVTFQPGINEDLAATAVAGSQQLAASPGARVEGVFALWYGKAPGLDRSGDALRHANAAGSARQGGVLVVTGDDHACKSSTLPSQSEYAFMDWGMPVLNPSNVQEVLDYGLIGWALSRWSGCYVGMIALADTMDSSATVSADIHRVALRTPQDFALPPGGLHFRPGMPPLEQEELLHRHRLYAALAFARENRLDTTLIDPEQARLGILTTGKAALDVRQALTDLGIDDAHAESLGIRLRKVAMSWPLEKSGIREFARGLDEILVVEEKRGVMENQLKEQLYHESGPRPRVVGKFDEHGEWLLPSMGDLSPALVARAIAQRLLPHQRTERVLARLAAVEAAEQARQQAATAPARTPLFCSGCPHNVSTRVPEGSRAEAGIGCHYMARWLDRRTELVSQMGGEGVHWIGQAPFTDEEHLFVNLGDGTYHHSGSLAIRAAIAAGVNVTYKLLFNDAVAMTGGQQIDGPLTVPQLTRQLADEGVGRIAVVSSDPNRYPRDAGFAPGVTFHRRETLDALQRELRQERGVSVLVYDQTCAAELRRRRKRGLAVDPPRRVFINEAVCEGCGDCSEQSSCVSIEPLETEFGRKRLVNQTSCNKDESCLNGLCPSFVTVEGGRLRKPPAREAELRRTLAHLPRPELPSPDEPWNVVVTGVGGTGVVTIGALLGMAAHLEGKQATVLDMTGLAQKGGAVISHVRLAPGDAVIHTPRVPIGSADLLLAADLLVAAGEDAVGRIDAGRTHSVVNTHLSPTAEFVLDNSVRYEPSGLLARVHDRSTRIETLDATRAATALLGDAVAQNLFLVGFAWQQGLLPLEMDSIERAVELNGVALEANRRALAWGRLAAHDLKRLARLVENTMPRSDEPLSRSLDERIERRARHLAAYQDACLAERYRGLVERVRAAEARLAPGQSELCDAVARGYHRVLAPKDEYEVARLHTRPEFRRQLAAQVEGDFRVHLHLAPPLFARTDPATGRPRKRAYGPWIQPVLAVLARLRFLRGSVFDVFRYTQERRMERALVGEYEATIETLLAELRPDNVGLAARIASLPEEIRGFGSIKLANRERVRLEEKRLLDRLLKPEDPGVGGGEDRREIG